jgi:predicted NBD/HSP70 family sugar kinase
MLSPMTPGLRTLSVPPGTREILGFIRADGAHTRSDLVRLTGLSRSTLSQRLEPLLDSGLVVHGDELASMGGRPPSSLVFNPRAGFVLVADCGASQTHTGVADLAGEILIDNLADVCISDGPEIFLTWLEARLDDHMNDLGINRESLRGVGVGLPGPVEHCSGRPVSPPIMPGWDGYGVADRLAGRFGVPALVDNDVNIMALGEHGRAKAAMRNMVFVKVSTGIGCGLILSNEIQRGAHGAAGDIGHIYVPGHDDTLCNCGNIGCLEAVASGQAIAQRLSTLERPIGSVPELVNQVLLGQPDAVAAVRDAGREIGGVLAALVNITDPDVIVIGGQLSQVDQPLIAGIREVVYRRSLPLATHNLRIVKSGLEEKAGIIGAALMVVEHLLSPAADQRDGAAVPAPPA